MLLHLVLTRQENPRERLQNSKIILYALYSYANRCCQISLLSSVLRVPISIFSCIALRYICIRRARSFGYTKQLSPPWLAFQLQNHQMQTLLQIIASFCCSGDPSINGSTWIECYNPSSNSWHRVSSIPGLVDNHVRKGFSMASIGESIYIIGGRLCRKVPGHDQDDVKLIDLEVLSSVLRYDIRTNTWSQCAPLDTPRFDFACTVSDNKVYVAGGICALDCARGISSAEVYAPALDEWKPLPNMNTLRYKCVGVTWQAKIHVVGGFAERVDPSTRVRWCTLERSSAEVYDLENDKWDLAIGMWQLDVPPNQIAAVNDCLFSSGDCLKTWKGHMEAYDSKLNMWNVVDGSCVEALSSPISTSDATEANWPPTQPLYLTMAPIGSQLYFLAGYKTPGERYQDPCLSFTCLTRWQLKMGGEALSPSKRREKKSCAVIVVLLDKNMRTKKPTAKLKPPAMFLFLQRNATALQLVSIICMHI